MSVCSLKMFLGTFFMYIIKIHQVRMKSKATLCYLYTWTQLEHIMHIILSKQLCADMHAHINTHTHTHTHTHTQTHIQRVLNYKKLCVCVIFFKCLLNLFVITQIQIRDSYTEVMLSSYILI